jgi:hypothetical protein
VHGLPQSSAHLGGFGGPPRGDGQPHFFRGPVSPDINFNPGGPECGVQ